MVLFSRIFRNSVVMGRPASSIAEVGPDFDHEFNNVDPLN